MNNTFKRLLLTPAWSYLLFWAWNAIFLAFMLLGFAPLILPGVFLAAQANIVPPGFLLTALLLILIPVLAVISGIAVWRREPRKLFAFGYAVEGPLMLLIAVRFFVVRELTPVLSLVFVVAGLGMVAFVWQLLDKKIDTRGALATHLRLLGLTLFVLVAVYAGIWLAFYAIPLAAYMIRGLIEALWHVGDILRGLWSALLDFPRNVALIPFMVFGLLAFGFSATLFVLMPLAVPFLVVRAWWRALKNYLDRFGTVPAAVLTAATATACAVLFVLLNQQPQHTVFALLESPPINPSQAQQLAAQDNAIRVGLLNAYLAPQRYVSSVGEVQHIRDLYRGAFGFTRDNYIGLERAYEVVASPLLYKPAGEGVPNARWNDGAIIRESNQAALLYEKYFDETIFNGERDAVLTALGSTWDVNGAAQAIQMADDRQVHLNRQELNVVEHGDWADFELHEEYQNESGQRREVLYFITLPESAVITGLWLGNSDNRDDRFAYRVAPRGAAQQVYREQVRRNVDPALVEQMGPRQYRVRVFPIEPKSLGSAQDAFGFSTYSVRQGPPLHFWLTWRVLAKDNAWTLPYLAEKRSVYWDSKTTRLLNGSPLAVPTDSWLPASVPARSSITPTTHRFDLVDGQTIIAQPVPAASVPALPDTLRLAVVLDRSRSMVPLAQDVNSALEQFKSIAGRGSKIDLYLTASIYRGEPATRISLDALNPTTLTYIGGQNPAELLQQFGQLRGAETYDAIFVLTDGTGYALGANDAKPASVNAPLWFVHLGGNFPLGYDDATLQEIQSTGGGVTGNLQDALSRFALALALKRGESLRELGATNLTPDSVADWVDNYVWLTLPTGQATTQFPEIASDENFAPFAARRLILANVQRERASLQQLNTLDQLHALAKQYSVVSPYSSMIVLVNTMQEQQLDELEKQGDRFDREIEEVGQTQSPFDVTAVPEPHEYLLMALGIGFVIWYARRRKRNPHIV